jgi:hypothetical protein
MLGVFRARSSFMGQRKLKSFLAGRTTVLLLYLDTILLMQLKVVLMKGKNAKKIYFNILNTALTWVIKSNYTSPVFWPRSQYT